MREGIEEEEESFREEGAGRKKGTKEKKVVVGKGVKRKGAI